ncbi:TetR/AcrR family transcriptional regulator [Chthonobacter albigriseus]|uniref:TetR/AcrR family transcriptional regulator n=1 Tax=Chthonobacter albigriseus TaxID=1683161 RepID=UPI001FCECDAF|nr:TetR/AcrR family transcriptional regulator [Chthonobacter albigriseus]
MAESPNQTYSPRQNAVLECALKVLVEGGERALTTARIAREANCSKESLYKWFGDRDGLLAAVIGFQAAKVRVKDAGQGAGDPDAFRASLVVFARDLLTVLAGDVSLALNRLAIGQASREGSALGRLLLERGRRTIETRARALLESGARAGHISGDLGEAYRVLYALVVRDSHVRLLLGDDLADDERDFATRADAAVDQFFRLHGADGKTGRAGPGPDNNS